MNLLESLVYNLPEKVRDDILAVASDSDDCCTVNCKSIGEIEDYISELQASIKLLTERCEQVDGLESFPGNWINEALSAIDRV